MRVRRYLRPEGAEGRDGQPHHVAQRHQVPQGAAERHRRHPLSRHDRARDGVCPRRQIQCKYETLHHQRPLFHSKESPLIQTLLSVYRAATGDESAQPLAIGGGTYARALKRGVGFGPEMGGEDCHIHQADEFIEVSRVALLLEIYRNALRELTKA